MKILLLYPEFPETYWSFKHALKFISKRSANVPLGILTVSSLIPGDWEKKFVDLNVNTLRDRDLKWADYVFISAISVQTRSVDEIISRCNSYAVKIVGGGPLFAEQMERYDQLDHLVLNEAEITLPLFFDDLGSGNARRVYRSERFADLQNSPLPDYSLVKLKKYATAAVQYSRGCPFNCEFCDITALFGRKVRTKSSSQILAELEQIYTLGWRGSVFFVDDNFIGHKRKLKNDLLPQMISWMQDRDHPFTFITESSINLADDPKLMEMMVKAGFSKVFVGIETPEESCLVECNKPQNNNRNLMQSVNRIQHCGMEVTAGFIVGFDNDPSNIFQRQVDFIQKSGIITAMVGLLNAPRLSNLYKRLKSEGRILNHFTGDNTDYSMNFIPKMNREELMQGYQKIIREIYSCKSYYERVKRFLMSYNQPFREKITLIRFMAFLKSVLYIGILKKNRKYYWKLVLWALFRRPQSFPLAVTYSIYGYHFRKVFKEINE